MRISPLLTTLTGSVLILATVHAQEWRVERGRILAESQCATCHAIGHSGDSPLPSAPAFRSLHFRYPPEDLGEALAKIHRVMPQFRELSGAQVLDLATYLQSLEQQ